MTEWGGKRDRSGRKPIDDPRKVRWPVRWTQGEEGLIEAAAIKIKKTPTDLIRDASLELANTILAKKEIPND